MQFMSSSRFEYDVCVVGVGPAGRAAASRATSAGLVVCVVDPRPDRMWIPTYGAWLDELPTWVPTAAIASRIDRPSVWTSEERCIDRAYGVLDKPALRAAMPLDEVKVEAQRAVHLTAHTVELASGTTITAKTVVDARGLGPTDNRQAASAHGIFVDADKVAHYVAEGEGYLLDWRDENDAAPDDPPSFLYTVPVGDGTVIFEETSLGRAGGLPQHELRRRVIARLAAHGIAVTGDEPTEAAHYPLDQPPQRRRRPDGPVLFGARGGSMHPCTGYSVAQSLAMADSLVDAVMTGADPVASLWPTRARLVYWLRGRGLTALGRLTDAELVALFDAFFAASPADQRALLSSHTDATRLLGVLVTTVARTPFRMRFDLVGWTNRRRWLDG